MAKKENPNASNADLLGALRSLPAFKPFSEEELQEIAPLCEIQQTESGQTILSEGEPSNNLVYFLLSGGVSVYVSEKFILSLHRDGDIFGEMSLISDEVRSATVKADEPTRLLVMNSALSYDTDQQQYHKFQYYFSRMFNIILTDKLRLTSERAKLYEDAIRQTLRAREQSTGLQEQVSHNLNQIRLYSHLVESAKDAILIVDTSGAIMEANPSLKNEFGIEPEDIIGRPVSALLDAEGGGGRSWERIAAAAGEGGWNGEIGVVCGEGVSLPADCSVSLVRDENSTALAYSMILRNIAQRKQYEVQIVKQSEELEKANKELMELDRLKDNFMTMVSHELRTPLSSIIAYSETLSIEGMVEPEDQQEFLGIIHSEAIRLNELVSKVLTISKIEAGQMLFEFKEGHLDKLLQFTAAALKPRFEKKNLKLLMKLPKECRPSTFDSDKIQEVLKQILDNALKFTEEGTVTLRLSQNGKETLIEVLDTGKGMEGKILTGAFSKFDWVENIQYHQDGIGLGLPLSFLIVNAHSGGVRVESEMGKGTTVSFTLPHDPKPPPQPSANS